MLVYALAAFALGITVFVGSRAPFPALALAVLGALALLHGALLSRAYENAHSEERGYAFLCRAAARKCILAGDILAEENRAPPLKSEQIPAPSEAGLLALRTARSAAGVSAQRGGVWKGVAVFTALAAVYVLILRLPIRPFVLITGLIAAFIAASVLFEIVRGWLERAQESELLRLISSLETKDSKEFQSKLEELSESRFDRIAAPAHTALSFLAERNCDFEFALAHANLATIHHLRARYLGRNRLPLPHELLAQRAFLLALLDRPEEARAELSWLKRSNAPSTDETRIRVEAVRALKNGENDRAAELFDQFDPRTLLSSREKWLLLAAYASPRLLGLKDADPAEKEWIELILPGIQGAARL